MLNSLVVYLKRRYPALVPYAEGLRARALDERVMSENYYFTGDDPALFSTDLGKMFRENRGNLLDKWHHYFEAYERHLKGFRGRPVRILEIGVQNGGSLEMWRRFFGQDAVLYGVDADPRCASLDGIAGKVRIGSQADAGFLRQVVDEMGGIDIVIDDGSHRSEDMRTSFEVLYPLLSEGGVYLVEDVHASYWAEYGGGYRRANSFVEMMKSVIDDAHHWYHSRRIRVPAARDRVFGLHFYDSIVVLEKRAISRPRRSRSGQTAPVRDFDRPSVAEQGVNVWASRGMPEERR